MLLRTIAMGFGLAVALAPHGSRAEEDAPPATPPSSTSVNLSALHVNWAVDGTITGATLAIWVLPEFFKTSIAPAQARWIDAPGIDQEVRNALVWPDPAPAALASDILVAAVPVGLGLWVFLEANSAGGFKTAAEDLIVVTEAMTVAGALTTVTRYTTARIRPYAYYGGGTGAPEDHLSFWSGHTTTAFSAAAAAGYVAQMRGYASWPWIYAVGFTAAGAVSYLRVAGDKHWMTDVVVGAVMGTGIGFLVPWLHRANPELGLRVLPYPQGMAVAGKF
jgi:membrane-associated phospholipid phosphatase